MSLWRRWFVVVTAGELVGSGVPFVLGTLVLDLSTEAEVALLVVARAIEGAVLGLAQAYVLRTALPAISRAWWVWATAGGAAVTWLIGMFLAVAFLSAASGRGVGEVPLVLSVVLMPVLGVAYLVSMGLFQWWVLRAYVPRASRWIGGTVLAWLLSTAALTAVTTLPLWYVGQSRAAGTAVGVLGGVVMSAVAAAVSGAVLVRMVRASGVIVAGGGGLQGDGA